MRREGVIEITGRDRPWDLVAGGIILGLVVVLSLSNARSLLLDALAFIAVIFVPGYAIQAAAFPRCKISASSKVPDWLERTALSLILSLALVGLITTLLAGGLGVVLLDIDSSVVLSVLLIITAAGSIVALDRRRRLTKEEAFQMYLPWNLTPLSGPEKMIAIGAVLVLLVAGLSFTVLQSSGQDNTYTSFYMTGPDGTVSSLPKAEPVGSEFNVTLNIKCMEGKTTRYHVSVWIGNSSNASALAVDWSGTNALTNSSLFYFDIAVENGLVWTQNIPLSIDQIGDHKISFLLVSEENTVRYIWLQTSIVI